MVADNTFVHLYHKWHRIGHIIDMVAICIPCFVILNWWFAMSAVLVVNKRTVTRLFKHKLKYGKSKVLLKKIGQEDIA